MVTTPCSLVGGIVAYRALSGDTRGEGLTLDVIELAAWAFGSLVGTWIALWLAEAPGVLMGLLVGGLLTGFNSYYFIPARMPTWFWVVGTLAGLAPSFLALSMRRIQPVETNAR